MEGVKPKPKHRKYDFFPLLFSGFLVSLVVDIFCMVALSMAACLITTVITLLVGSMAVIYYLKSAARVMKPPSEE